jgi:putative tryptophan/tyrosine transport system substrate-binding protein
MIIRIGRRQLITALGGAAATWSLAARAQQPAMPVIGFLHSASPSPFTRLEAAFRAGLNQEGYVEGRNTKIEFRWAGGQYDRLPALATELVERQVAVIAAFGPPTALAAKAATTTIPIVFTTGDDPVKAGLVASLNRPGGNVTGVSIFAGILEGKRLELLGVMVPKATTIAVLINPTTRQSQSYVEAAQTAASALGRQIAILMASNESDFEGVFAAISERRIGALLVGTDIFFNGRRDQLVELAARHAVPAMYEFREFVDAGGLMSYGTSLAETYRQAGIYVGEILKGAKPADLPVVQSTKFEFVINLKTAKALGLTVPPGLLTTADDFVQ